MYIRFPTLSAIRHKAWHAEALQKLGTAYAQTQQWEQAHASWTEAMRIVPSMGDFSCRAKAWQDQLTAYVQTQQWEQAHVILSEVLSAVSEESPSDQAKVLQHIVTVYAQTQQWEQAHAILPELLSAVYDLHSFSHQASILLDIATIYIQTQQWEQAHAILMKDWEANFTYSYRIREEVSELRTRSGDERNLSPPKPQKGDNRRSFSLFLAHFWEWFPHFAWTFQVVS